MAKLDRCKIFKLAGWFENDFVRTHHFMFLASRPRLCLEKHEHVTFLSYPQTDICADPESFSEGV